MLARFTVPTEAYSQAPDMAAEIQEAEVSPG